MEVEEERSGEEKSGEGRSEGGRREGGEDMRKMNRGREEDGEIKERGGERRLTREKTDSLKSQPQSSICSR